MPKKLLMNNNIDEDTIILCENYSPNRQTFYLWQDEMIDWNNYELYMNIDLSNFTLGDWGNVLTIGRNIASWSGDGKWHIYYDGYNKKIRLQLVFNTYDKTLDISLNNLNEIEIIINKKGVYLNGELKLFNDHYLSVVNDIFIAKPISIGSQEGAYKGIAKYKKVSLRKYQERG